MKRLFIIMHPSTATDYIFEDVKYNDKVVILSSCLAAPKNLFLKISRFLFVGKFPLPLFILKFWFDEIFLRKLSEISNEDIVLVFENINFRALGMLVHFLPKKTKLYNWFGNPLYPLYKGKDPTLKLNKMKTMGFELVTFDPLDARNYGLDYHIQYLRYPKEEILPIEDTDYDFYFCGDPKDREVYLLKLKEYLEGNGYICKFVIPHSSNEYISYEKNMEYVMKSKCIIDIYQERQSGLTRRPLEALFCNRKLLTNNSFIKDTDLYVQENVYLLNEDNWKGIHGFMDQKQHAVSDELKNRYDVNSWLLKFMDI